MQQQVLGMLLVGGLYLFVQHVPRLESVAGVGGSTGA